MNKFWYFFICILILIGAGLFFAWNQLPDWISKTLSEKMGVSVSIDYLSCTHDTATIHYLNVKNPEGFDLDSALRVKKIKVKTPISSFFHNHIEIDEVLLSDLYLGLEFESPTNTRGNWTILMDSLRSSLNNSTSSSKESRTFLIKRLAVNNINIDLLFKKGGGKVKHLKPIAHMEFKNVSSEGPFPMGQLTNVIMSEILKEIFIEQGLKNMLQDAIKSPGQGVYNSIRSLFSWDSTINQLE